MIATHANALGESKVPSCTGGRRWVGMIFALIGLNIGIVATTVYFAASDRSAGIEPDYYARALQYDQVILQRAVNKRLGWHSLLTLTASPDGKSATLKARLIDADSKPVSAALVRAVAFSSLRSSERSSVQLRESPDGYIGTVPVSATGQWRIRLTANLGPDTFTTEQDVVLSTGTPSKTGIPAGDSR